MANANALLIDPRSSSWIGQWDAITSLALVFVAFVTPIEVALPLEVTTDALFMLNRIVDAIFVIDMLFAFVTVYKTDDDVWVSSPAAIAMHYLKGWFIVDLVSIGVSGIDVYVIVSEATASSSSATMDDGEMLNNLRTLRIVRVLRFFRLIKLVRLVRAARIFARWENKIAINYNSLQLIKAVVAAMVFSHWIACTWLIQAFMLQVRMRLCLVCASVRLCVCASVRQCVSASVRLCVCACVRLCVRT